MEHYCGTETMKKILLLLLFIPLALGCLSDIKDTPLTAAEQKLLGRWKYIQTDNNWYT